MILDARNEVTNPGGRGSVAKTIGIAIHHSVTDPNGPSIPDHLTTEAEERAHIRAIDRYHVSVGYGGFGYHFAVFPSGRTYLCGTGQRAHVAGRNHELYGVCLIGDFRDHLPSLLDPQMQATHQLLLDYPELEIRGHNDWSLPGQGTLCPGLLGAVDWRSPVWGTVAPPPMPPTKEELKTAAGELWFFAEREWGLADFPYPAPLRWAVEQMKD